MTTRLNIKQAKAKNAISSLYNYSYFTSFLPSYFNSHKLPYNISIFTPNILKNLKRRLPYDRIGNISSRRGKRRYFRFLLRAILFFFRIYKYNQFSNLTSFKHLYTSAKQASKGVSWKVSVQRYLSAILFRIARTQQQLKQHQDIRKGFINFDINERGKVRHIQSVHFSERVVQKCLNKYILYPLFTPSFISNNCASQKGKGTHYCISNLEKHLHEFYRHYKTEGYILLVDFHSYFENINHEILKNLYSNYIVNPDILYYTNLFIDAFGDKGLGLGSETSQLNAVLYPNKIDHYIKEVLGVRYYGRYMDDSYLLCESKSKLKAIKKKLEQMYEDYKIELNRKKTKIYKISNFFTFLKIRFKLLDTGKLLKFPVRRYITYERRKLQRLLKLYESNFLTIEDISTNIVSWCGSLLRKTCHRTMYSIYKYAKTAVLGQ